MEICEVAQECFSAKHSRGASRSSLLLGRQYQGINTLVIVSYVLTQGRHLPNILTVEISFVYSICC